jgi:hypothetical protein
MIPPTSYHADAEGLHIYVNREKVATIPAAQFGALVYALAAVMSGRK